jgi:hypothetical protein
VKPAEVLKRLLPRWRASLPARYSPADVDGFIRRNRAAMEALIVQALARRKAERGRPPETAEEFAGYDAVVARERPRDAESDNAVIRRVMKRVDELLAEHYRELFVLRNVVEYIDARAEAILLRNAGWDAVPLFLDRPAIAVLAPTVVAVRDAMGYLAIHPARAGTLHHLIADTTKAEAKTAELCGDINIELNTNERVGRYASSLWKHARASMPQYTPRASEHMRRFS